MLAYSFLLHGPGPAYHLLGKDVFQVMSGNGNGRTDTDSGNRKSGPGIAQLPAFNLEQGA